MDNSFQFHRIRDVDLSAVGDTIEVVRCEANPHLIGFIGKVEKLLSNGKGVWVESKSKEKHWFFDHEIKVLRQV